MKINNIMSAYEEQLKKYEKLSFSEAQEKIKNVSDETDENKKRMILQKFLKVHCI